MFKYINEAHTSIGKRMYNNLQLKEFFCLGLRFKIPEPNDKTKHRDYLDDFDDYYDDSYDYKPNAWDCYYGSDTYSDFYDD